jgi:zinc D-Ala-D-Ala dipeptidase
VIALALVLAVATGASPAPAAPALSDVAALVPDAIVDLRYATDDNFLGHAVYPQGARCLLRADVAPRLVRAAARLRERGLRLVLWDCYRPLAVQQEMWRLFPKPGYVANPARGSNHNRGAAVDLAIAAADGSAVPLPTPFDSFEPRAHADATDVPEAARASRDALRVAMEAEGFRVNRMEWWHFDAPEAKHAPVLDVAMAGASTATATSKPGPDAR